MHKLLITQAQEQATALYNRHDEGNLHYHNLEHTQFVVEKVKEIGEHYHLPENEMAILEIAAWFHDTGHLFASPAEHEDKSVEIMREFMAQHNIDPTFTEEVEKCILVTRLSHEPQSQLEEIIRDADTYNFGLKEFKQTNKAVKKEYEARGMSSMMPDWAVNTVNLLKSHRFYTDYCRNLLDDRKQKNIAKFSRKLGEGSVNQSEQPLFHDPAESGKGPTAYTTKGIQTMLRLTSENHLELSALADGKANILISVNAIIISVILTVLIRKIEVDTHLTIPTLWFLGFSVATIILAILATRPQVTTGNFNRDDVVNKKTNLLFFGNFFNSSLKDYKWAMSIMMRDPDYLYGNLVQDIHTLGGVLGRKYRLLRKAYNLFMIGIITSVIAFILAIMLHNPQTNAVINTTSTSPL